MHIYLNMCKLSESVLNGSSRLSGGRGTGIPRAGEKKRLCLLFAIFSILYRFETKTNKHFF